MTTTTVYKSFDSSQFLFEMIWKHFPTIRTYIIDKKIINNLLITSEEFCDLKSKNIFHMKYFSQGGFGMVGTIGLNKKPENLIKAAIYSFERSNKHNLFYVDIIIKIGINNNPPKIFKTHDSSISITDPLSDMIFGSVLSHLYDIGVCPFITKYFGTYLCKKKNETSMLLEASDFELRKKLSRYDKSRLNVSEFKNIIAQYIYCLYILKIYFGTIHFDTHLRNIMLTDIKKKDYMYHGKFFKNLDYILLETGLKDKEGNGIIILLKKSSYLLKLIDYGCMLFCFDRSVFDRFRKDLRIETDLENIKSIGAFEALMMSKTNQSYGNTVDFMFTIINIYEFLSKGLDNGNFGDESAENYNIEYLNIINGIMFDMIGMSMKDFLNNNPQFKIQKIDGEYDWFMRNHSCGFTKNFENPKFLIDLLIKMCVYKITVNQFPFKQTIYYNNSVSLYLLEDYKNIKISEENSIFISCNISDYVKLFNRFEKIINYEKKCKYNKSYCEILKVNNQPPFETFIPSKKYVFLEGKNLKLSKLLINSNDFVFKFKKNNSWLNFKEIPKNLLNTDIQEIITFLIKFKSKITKSNSSLKFNNFLTETKGILIPLTNNISTIRDTIEPLGFFAIKNPPNILHNNYKKEYNKFLAILMMDDESNELVLEYYEDFINRHQTKIVNNEEIIKVPIELKFGNKYEWAVTIGPILIWDKVLGFSEENILNNKEFSNIFTGKNKGFYNMNDSLEIQSQLVYIQKEDISGILFIEGNGQLSPGLDKFGTAKLCQFLNVDYAVCLASGSFANVLYKSSNDTFNCLNKFLDGKIQSVSLDVCVDC